MQTRFFSSDSRASFASRKALLILSIERPSLGGRERTVFTSNSAVSFSETFQSEAITLRAPASSNARLRLITPSPSSVGPAPVSHAARTTSEVPRRLRRETSDPKMMASFQTKSFSEGLTGRAQSAYGAGSMGQAPRRSGKGCAFSLHRGRHQTTRARGIPEKEEDSLAFESFLQLVRRSSASAAHIRGSSGVIDPRLACARNDFVRRKPSSSESRQKKEVLEQIVLAEIGARQASRIFFLESPRKNPYFGGSSTSAATIGAAF